VVRRWTDGTRPLPDPTAYWESPDLWLSGGIDKAKAKVGVPNQIWARVYNFGPKPVTGINVEVVGLQLYARSEPSQFAAVIQPGQRAHDWVLPGDGEFREFGRHPSLRSANALSPP